MRGTSSEFAAKVGAEALNFGAKREATGKVYDEFDLYDAFTANIALASEMVTALVETLTEREVFRSRRRRRRRRRADARGRAQNNTPLSSYP